MHRKAPYGSAEWERRQNEAAGREQARVAENWVRDPYTGELKPKPEPAAAAPSGRLCRDCPRLLPAGYCTFCPDCLNKTRKTCRAMGSPNDKGEPQHCQLEAGHEGPHESCVDLVRRRQNFARPPVDTWADIYLRHPGFPKYGP